MTSDWTNLITKLMLTWALVTDELENDSGPASITRPMVLFIRDGEKLHILDRVSDPDLEYQWVARFGPGGTSMDLLECEIQRLNAMRTPWAHSTMQAMAGIPVFDWNPSHDESFGLDGPNDYDLQQLHNMLFLNPTFSRVEYDPASGNIRAIYRGCIQTWTSDEVPPVWAGYSVIPELEDCGPIIPFTTGA